MRGTIGTDKSGYANQRNISGLPFEHYAVRRAPNLFRYPNYLHFRLTGRAHPYYDNLYLDLGGKYDLLHFFNSLSMGRKPWLTTFETSLPRWTAYGKGRLERGLKLQAREQCRHLIALSECTRQIQAAQLEDWTAYRDDIMDKVLVMHPPQAPLIRSMGEKPALAETLQLVLVGADFFRKGGLEVLRVLERGWERGWKMHLTVVSTMQAEDYASQAGTPEIDAADRIMGRFARHITHHPHLPNDEVLDVLRAADLALLPTWADTYGYFVLEAQAAGVPVISTNVRALPEINPPAAGWQIEVPRDRLGNAVIGHEAERRRFRKTVEEQLDAVLEQIAGDPGILRTKGKAAWLRIKQCHNPKTNARTLEGLYDKILGK